MNIRNVSKTQILLSGVLVLLTGCQTTQTNEPRELSNSEIAKASEFMPHVLKAKVINPGIKPNWLKSNPRQFWYEAQDANRRQTFYLVDTKKQTQVEIIDKSSFANKLGKARLDWQGFPIKQFTLDNSVATFELDNEQYKCGFDSYLTNCTRETSQQVEWPDYLSPDKRHYVKVQGFNLFLCQAEDDACQQLTKDGTELQPYAVTHPYPETKLNDENFDEQKNLELYWSGNSRFAVTYRLNREGVNKMHLTDSVADPKFSVKTVDYYYPQAGDKTLPSAELVLIDVIKQSATLVDIPAIMQTYYGGPLWGYWHKNHYYYHDRRRGNKEYYLRKLDPVKAEVKTIIKETDHQFIDPWVQTFRLLNDNKHVIWTSQRTGYQHLYLYDVESGKLVNAITSGDYTVRVIRGVDEKNGVVYFEASGKESERDPYLRHLYRVGLDGKGLRLLTPEAMEHDTSVSPDFSVVIDTFSDFKTPHKTVVRDAESGEILMKVADANATGLLQIGWRPPEAFSVLAQDGKTRLYGLMYKPSNFDDSKRYAVINDTYTGPHNFFTPKSFVTYNNQRPALAELGFIVIKMDGRGTNKRGKAFHRHSFKNLAGGTDDHVWAIKQLAKTHLYLDLNRVGIFGFSAGGYDTVQAMLRHPDFFKVGVSASGNHDFRVDKAGWNEIWMGWPETKEWQQQSNYTNVHRLKGKLLLGHGELDSNVHPAATLRLVDKLIDANKDFDLLIMPRMGHVLDDHPYWVQKRWRYFLKHL